jgi:hypothetical protein
MGAVWVLPEKENPINEIVFEHPIGGDTASFSFDIKTVREPNC